MWLILLSIFSAKTVFSQQWTTHSPLTAFKQLGFEESGSYGAPQSKPSYIPYSISDFNDQSTTKLAASSFQQIRHPNDILSNMGVDLPSQEILGKIRFFTRICLLVHEGDWFIALRLPCQDFCYICGFFESRFMGQIHDILALFCDFLSNIWSILVLG